MIHYGDITKIKGAEVPLVDVVTGGSPCQDLSIAGKRKGLAGERSGLFMEQIRVIKELRDESRKKLGTDDPRRIVPRFMVWENVPGAFSSNNGEDFRAVLEETARIADKAATIPRPAEKKGKLQWSTSGCIMGDGWSIAWRVHDAQFWGVPQRRKRIALVADFAGGCAPEILFEREGLPRDSEQSEKEREEVAGSIGEGIDKAITFQERGGKPGGGKGILIQNDRTGALSTVNNQMVFDASRRHDYQQFEDVCETDITCLNDQGGSVMSVSENVVGALRAQEHGHQPIVFEPGAASRVGGHVYEDKAGTVRANAGDNQQAVVVSNDCYAIQGNCIDRSDTAGCNGKGWREDKGYTLNTMDRHAVVYGISSYNSNAMKSDNPNSGIYEAETTRTLDLNGGNPACNQGGMAVIQGLDAYNQTSTGDVAMPIRSKAADADHIPCTYSNTSVVRRLTPMECERLQGFPDHWTDIGDWVDSKGKKHKGESDSPRYKALGNSIALPFWQWMAERMVRLIKNDEPEKEPTMASLFDGIGGFPLVYSRCGCKPVWASEVENFAIAVTKVRFPENATPQK
jgi:DNA (cytosine-5)-methyltransferase 1